MGCGASAQRSAVVVSNPGADRADLSGRSATSPTEVSPKTVAPSLHAASPHAASTSGQGEDVPTRAQYERGDGGAQASEQEAGADGTRAAPDAGFDEGAAASLQPSQPWPLQEQQQSLEHGGERPQLQVQLGGAQGNGWGAPPSTRSASDEAASGTQPASLSASSYDSARSSDAPSTSREDAGGGDSSASHSRMPGGGAVLEAVLEGEGGATSVLRWQRGELLGRGAFGAVYLGLNVDTGELMAVKQIEVPVGGSRMPSSVSAKLREVHGEVALLQGLRHPNIVRYIGTATDEAKGMLSIFLEYVPGGSIAQLLMRFGSFHERVVRAYARQILKGLAYLHGMNCVHRDIKGANLLVDNSGFVKLADFGASKSLATLTTLAEGARSIKGTPYWMAPEVIKQTGHNSSADIWSVGCTIIEMATGKPPFCEYTSQVSALFHIASSKAPPPVPDSLSPEGRDFLRQCMRREPRERPTAEELLTHAFVTTQVPSDYVAPPPPPQAQAAPAPAIRFGSDPAPAPPQQVLRLVPSNGASSGAPARAKVQPSPRLVPANGGAVAPAPLPAWQTPASSQSSGGSSATTADGAMRAHVQYALRAAGVDVGARARPSHLAGEDEISSYLQRALGASEVLTQPLYAVKGPFAPHTPRYSNANGHVRPHSPRDPHKGDAPAFDSPTHPQTRPPQLDLQRLREEPLPPAARRVALDGAHVGLASERSAKMAEDSLDHQIVGTDIAVREREVAMESARVSQQSRQAKQEQWERELAEELERQRREQAEHMRTLSEEYQSIVKESEALQRQRVPPGGGASG